MKIQFAFLVFHLAKDVKKCYCYNKKNISSNKGLMIYNSELVQNMQVSVEMFYKFFISNKIISKNDNKTLFMLLIFELIKSGFKFKEFFNFNNIGYPFYINKSVFYDKILEVSEEDYFNYLSNNEIDKNLSIYPKKGTIFIPVNSNVNIPIPSKINHSNFLLITKNTTNLKMEQIGEIFYIIKPIVYMTLYAAYRDNPMISLVVNAIMDFIIFIFKMNKKAFSFSVKKAYHYEFVFRKIRLMNYFIREPIYEKYTKPILLQIFNFIKFPTFLINIFFEVINYYKYLTFISN